MAKRKRHKARKKSAAKHPRKRKAVKHRARKHVKRAPRRHHKRRATRISGVKRRRRSSRGSGGGIVKALVPFGVGLLIGKMLTPKKAG